ncbi:MAG: response regulator, partial [Sphingobacteriia bacterium]
MSIATILWVDDEIESLQSQIIFLESKGYAVYTLTNGFDALEYIKTADVDVVLMDDAFQHRQVKTGLSVLLFDYNKIFEKDWMLPFGNLREPLTGIYRADVVMITKTPKIFSPMERRRVESHLPHVKEIPFVYSFLRYGELKSLHSNHMHRLFAELD